MASTSDHHLPMRACAAALASKVVLAAVILSVFCQGLPSASATDPKCNHCGTNPSCLSICQANLRNGGSPSSGSSSGSKCFPASAQVETIQGKRAISSLTIGDKILAVDAIGHFKYEPVYMFSHHDESIREEFFSLETVTNKTVRLTPGHYVWATFASALLGQPATFSQVATITKPEDLSVGDYLWERNVSSYRLQPAQIARISRVDGTGLFNPHVFGGSVIVDGIAALVFSDVLSPSILAHQAVTIAARFFSAIFPSNELAMTVNMKLLKVMGKAD